MPTWTFDDELRRCIRSNLACFRRRTIPIGELIPAAVAATIVGDEDGQAAFVLTRRPSKLRRHGGQWSLPGGRLEPGETPVLAALRESREEVGLELTPSDTLGLLDDFATRSGFRITPVVVWGPSRPELTPDPEEVASVHVVPLTELFRPDVPRITETAVHDRPLIAIDLSHLETTVYAPTAALVYQLREVALEGRATRVAHFEQPRFAWS